jgi:hypothetical protein
MSMAMAIEEGIVTIMKRRRLQVSEVPAVLHMGGEEASDGIAERAGGGVAGCGGDGEYGLRDAGSGSHGSCSLLGDDDSTQRANHGARYLFFFFFFVGFIKIGLLFLRQIHNAFLPIQYRMMLMMLVMLAMVMVISSLSSSSCLANSLGF